MNETIRKFGYPATLIREYDHWVVLLRPAQLTLGSLVLAAKSEATDFNDLSPAAFTELKRATAHINTALSKAVSHAKQIGRAHVCTPVTNAHLVCRLLLEKKKNTRKRRSNGNTTVSQVNE